MTSANPDELPAAPRAGRTDASRIQRAAEVLRHEARAIAGLESRLGPSFETAVDLVLGCTGMVVVTGMGKAGLVGAKISATLASTGTPSLTLHPGEALHGDLGRIRAQDLVLALSNSGETAEIKALLPAAKRIGAQVLAITESANSTLGRFADAVLELGPVSEACPLGLAPTTSTSAMLALGDALSMVVSEERGFSTSDFARFHPAGSLGRRLMQVREVMRTGPQVAIIGESATLADVLELGSRTKGRPGATLIVDSGGQLTGIFTDGDMRRMLETIESGPRKAPIAPYMGRSPRFVRPDQLVDEALAALRTNKIDQLAVLDDQRRPIGLLDVQDVLDVQV